MILQSVNQESGRGRTLAARPGSPGCELNRTGRRFWELLAGCAELDVIEDALAAEFDVPGSELSAEVASMVEGMRAEKLSTIGDVPLDRTHSGVDRRQE
jgi:hypothetical protein